MNKKRGGIKRKHLLQGLSQDQILWGIVIVVGLAVLFTSLYPKLSGDPDGPLASIGLPLQQAKVARHPLTGLWLDEEVEKPYVFGLMIDNHHDAQPQSGLSEAFLVVEAPVEAGIPRMIAFFYEDQDIDKIGPIRSARPYFLDWNNELDALYSHVGGSNAALDKIASGGTFNLNQYYYGSFFWRSSTRLAPHNVYTSTNKLNKYLHLQIERDRAPKKLYDLWTFKDPAKDVSDEPLDVSIDYWAPYYTIQWSYDKEEGRYLRLQNNRADKTLEGEPLYADNVAIVITNVSIIDSVGRRKVRTMGEGKAYVMQDGKMIEARWEKESASNRLRFFDGEDEIAMNPGVTWINVVPREKDVTFED